MNATEIKIMFANFARKHEKSDKFQVSNHVTNNGYSDSAYFNVWAPGLGNGFIRKVAEAVS